MLSFSANLPTVIHRWLSWHLWPSVSLYVGAKYNLVVFQAGSLQLWLFSITVDFNISGYLNFLAFYRHCLIYQAQHTFVFFISVLSNLLYVDEWLMESSLCVLYPSMSRASSKKKKKKSFFLTRILKNCLQ